jgi:hypothetical protein
MLSCQCQNANHAFPDFVGLVVLRISQNCIVVVIIIVAIVIDECNTAVAALFPGVDMSFLPAGVVNMSRTSSDDNSDDSTDDPDDASTSSDDSNLPDDNALPTPHTKRARRVYERKPMNISTWWLLFLTPEARTELMSDPHGKVSSNFCRAFRVPYLYFKEKILEFAVCRWWPDWNHHKVDAFGRLVADLKLNLLSTLNVLGMGANHFSVRLQTNISEEVHRTFFLEWIGLMASIKKLFIYMPQDDLQLKFVTDEYKAMGLPGCVGSVDCDHVGWDQCLVQCKNMYKVRKVIL